LMGRGGRGRRRRYLFSGGEKGGRVRTGGEEERREEGRERETNASFPCFVCLRRKKDTFQVG